jgi:hypothetical protein
LFKISAVYTFDVEIDENKLKASSLGFVHLTTESIPSIFTFKKVLMLKFIPTHEKS